MGSTRLPGKVLKRLADRSVLAHVIERCKQIPGISDVVVATSVLPADEQIALEASACGVAFYRGSETDCLQRFYEAATAQRAEGIMRITSDCPLLDAQVSGNVLTHYLQEAADYCSNTAERRYPRGLDTEVFSMDALERAHREAQAATQREHVTQYMYQNPHLFRLRSVVGEQDYAHYRWTLDTAEDWRLIEQVYAELYKPSPAVPFAWTEVLALYARKPELHSINAHVEQKKL
jgi:spore coat polysaccharide biosynthesis protein SpsF